ncbi:MAG: HNH endonuclease [Enterobacterales bacterium]
MPLYTLHHHQSVGRIQLVLTEVHSQTTHIDGDKIIIWK